MGINMVMMALDRQKVEFEKPRLILLSAIGKKEGKQLFKYVKP